MKRRKTFYYDHQQLDFGANDDDDDDGFIYFLIDSK